MEPIVTHGNKEDSAQEHARRLAAQRGLVKLYLELKAELDLSDRLDSVVDRIFGAALLLVGIATAFFCVSYISDVLSSQSLTIAVIVRYVSWLLAGFCIGIVLVMTGLVLIRVRMSVSPATVIGYALIIAFVFGVFGLVGVIPIAILFL